MSEQTIKLKRSNQTGKEPTEGQLELGEVAINTKDGKMFIKKSDEANPTPNEEIVEVGKIAKGLDAPTDEVITLGDNNELSISVTDAGGGTINSTISETGNGSLLIKGTHLGLTSPSDEMYLLASENQEVGLYYDGNLKLTTSATGINVNDKIVADDLVLSESINVASGKLFVSNSGSANSKYYTKMGDYGEGNFFGKHGSVNGAQYTLGVGSGGKIVEDQHIKTFRLRGDDFKNLNTAPKTLIPAESGKAHIIHEVVFYVDAGTYKGTAAGGFDTVNRPCYGVGIFSIADTYNSVFYSYAGLPRNILIAESGSFLWAGEPDSDYRVLANRDIHLRSSAEHEITNSTKVPNGDHYVKIRYSTLSLDADFATIDGLVTTYS